MTVDQAECRQYAERRGAGEVFVVARVPYPIHSVGFLWFIREVLFGGDNAVEHQC